MADEFDQASEIMEMALKRTLKTRLQFDGNSEKECLECGCTIPEQRRKLGGIKYCVFCQSAREKKGLL